MITIEYIHVVLACISRAKDIITPNLGGNNTFFSIEKDRDVSLNQNIVNFVKVNHLYYEEQFDKVVENIELENIGNFNMNV